MNRTFAAASRAARPAHARGFSLLEIMIALALGLLLSAGILSLFGSTSQTNKLQNGLARLQENGRFAITRMESDLRSVGAQYCSNSAGGAATGTVVPVMARRTPAVLAQNLGFPDSGPNQGGASLAYMNSVDAAGFPSATPAGTGYALSPRYFVQGYACDSAGECTTGLPSDLPPQGLDAGNRLMGSDVLTVRYLRGSGWPIRTGSSCAAGGALSFEERPGDDPVNFEPGTQLAYVTNCVDAAVLPVASYGGAGTLVMDTQLGGVAGPSCDSPGGRDMRVFNFSKDFVTITYYVELVADESPDARPNSAAAERLVPVLVRRENGVRQELVRGVDELKFLYGVQDLGGVTNFMDADAVDTGGACPPMPFGVTTQEPGCLWRAVRTIEAHLLVNTGDEVMGLDPISRSYRFMDVEFTPTDTSTLPSGLLARSMLRREFIAYASNRNYNF